MAKEYEVVVLSAYVVVAIEPFVVGVDRVDAGVDAVEVVGVIEVLETSVVVAV